MSKLKSYEERAERLVEQSSGYAYDAFVVLREGGMTKANALRWIASKLRKRINAFMTGL